MTMSNFDDPLFQLENNKLTVQQQTQLHKIRQDEQKFGYTDMED